MSLSRGPGLVFGGLLQTALTNERLFLMGITSLALSFASGWTTFEGMTNFTRSPVLCFLITFGVQGIMLVSAWMIGEAFAANHSKKFKLGPDGKPLRAKNSAGKAISGAYERLGNFFKVSLICLVFLFAMAISVFFSFDSLFSSIFSDDERARSAEIRATSQVSGVLADLKTRIEDRKFEAVDTLFSSEGWKEYNTRLDELGKIARSAPELVEQQLLSKLRSEQTEIARHQETLAQAQGQKAALKGRQERVTQNIARLTAERPSLLAEVNQLRSAERDKQRLADQKQAEATKEARGIGQTGREGEGPKFRAIKDQLRRLTAELDVIKGQKTIAQNRLEALDRQIAAQKREMALINGDMAKIDGEASVAKKFITAQEERQTDAISKDLSATASIDSLDDARDKFRQQPGRQTFLTIQQNCTNLHNALSAVPKIAPEIRSLSCEPGAAASTVAARIFTLDEAGETQTKSCVIGKEQNAGSIDPLLKLGQRCIQDSGLPEKDSNELRAILSRIDLNRDDKAKNFVVTLNAFQDGNWLAYLALCLACAIDSLVFLSGLIGARTASYENTGSPSDVMKYGLGMSTTIHGHEPEDIYTRKVFFRSVSGPSLNPGFLAVIDVENLTNEERNHVNKVLTIAGDKILVDERNPHIFHIEEKFYQNLARQVYLWDQFNAPKETRKAITSIQRAKAKVNKLDHPIDMEFGAKSKGAVIRKGTNRPPVFEQPEKTTASTEDPAVMLNDNVITDGEAKASDIDIAKAVQDTLREEAHADNENNPEGEKAVANLGILGRLDRLNIFTKSGATKQQDKETLADKEQS